MSTEQNVDGTEATLASYTLGSLKLKNRIAMAP